MIRGCGLGYFGKLAESQSAMRAIRYDRIFANSQQAQAAKVAIRYACNKI